MNLKICLNLFLILCAVSGMIKEKKPVKEKEVLEDNKDTWSQVTVMTWNTDALFDKLDHKEDNDQISDLAQLLGRELFSLEPNSLPELVVLHLQEVTSCASASNSVMMALKTTSISVQDSSPKDYKKSNVFLNLQTFGGLLGNVLHTLYKAAYICEDIHFFQAIGTVICKRFKHQTPVIERILETHFGETKDKGYLGFKVGFKGGLVLRARLENPKAPDLIFVNIHASSKAIRDRRRHFLAVFNLAMEEEYDLNKGDKFDKSALFFFAGDFNARTGTNLKGVTDKTWSKPVNLLGQKVRECNLPLTKYVVKTGNLGKAFTSLGDMKDPINGLGCQQVFGLMQESDEYMTWLKNKPNILNSIYAYNPKKEVSGVFSPVQEAPKLFLPSYCLQRGHTTSYGHLEKGGIVHYTDRIFYATRVSLTDHSIDGIFWTIKPVAYSGHTVDFLSDHGTVFGSYKIIQSTDKPDWYQKNLDTTKAFKDVKKKDDVFKYIVSLTEVDFIDQDAIESISEIINGGNTRVRFVRRPRVIRSDSSEQILISLDNQGPSVQSDAKKKLAESKEIIKITDSDEEESLKAHSDAKKRQSLSIAMPENLNDLVLTNVATSLLSKADIKENEFEFDSVEDFMLNLDKYDPEEDEEDVKVCEKKEKKKIDEFASRKRSSSIFEIVPLTTEQMEKAKSKNQSPGPSQNLKNSKGNDKDIQLRSLLNAPNKII